MANLPERGVAPLMIQKAFTRTITFIAYHRWLRSDFMIRKAQAGWSAAGAKVGLLQRSMLCVFGARYFRDLARPPCPGLASYGNYSRSKLSADSLAPVACVPDYRSHNLR